MGMIAPASGAHAGCAAMVRFARIRGRSGFLEQQVPDTVAELLAAAFELGLRSPGRPGSELALAGTVAPAG